MTSPAPLVLYRTPVLSEWVDYNGHMNDACYGVVFSHAVDALMVHLGMDPAYRERTGRSIFTLEAHICFLQEAKEGEPLFVCAELLGFDRKRLRVFLSLRRTRDGMLLATSEQMLLHVDLAGPSAASFDDDLRTRIQALWEQDVQREVPEQAGRPFKTLTHSRIPNPPTA